MKRDNSTFTMHMKERMKAMNMKQSHLSALTGIGRSGISQYLSGKNFPRKEHQERLAAVLDCSIEYLNSEHVDDDPHLITVKEAAEKLNVLPQCIRQGLKNNTFPFGYAVKTKCGKYRYTISSRMLDKYLKNIK